MPETHCREVRCDGRRPLGEDPPVLHLPFQCLMSRPHPPLHHLLLHRICVISGSFHLIRVAPVALVGLNWLARIKEAHEDFVENLNVYIHTGRVRTLDPHQVPRADVNTQLVAQGGLPRVHVGHKGIPLFCNFFLGDAKVSPVVCYHVQVFPIATPPLARSISIVTSSGLPLSSSGIVRWTDQLGFLANERFVWYDSDSEILMTYVLFNVKI
jgi:hypothetical protein